MRGISLGFFLFFIVAVSSQEYGKDQHYGKLSREENRDLQETCGSYFHVDGTDGFFYNQHSDPHSRKFLTAISKRHIIVDVNTEFLNFTFDSEKCIDNVIEFDVSLKDFLGNPNNVFVTEAHYIGSCDEPRGFVLLEFHPEFSQRFSPICLSDIPLEPETTVQVFTTRNVTAQSVEYIYTKIQNGEFPDQMVTELFVKDYGGPVFDSKSKQRTLVGHAYGHENEKAILISPIHKYIDQICATTGICVGDVEYKMPSLEELKLFKWPLHEYSSSDESLEEAEPKIEISFGESENVKINSFEEVEQPVIALTEVEFETYDVESEANTIFFSSEEHEAEKPLNVISVVPEEKFEPSQTRDGIPDTATIVRAEPYSAIIIPFPGTEIENYNQRNEFSTPTELLIAFLILLSLLFYVCMCVNGCIDNPEDAWKLPA